jgi:hypothetical protein
VASFAETVRRVVLEPAGFFSRITSQERVRPPIAFAVICGVVSLALGIVVELLIPVDFGTFGGGSDGIREAVPERFGGLAVAGILLGFVVLAPLLILIGLYIGALIYQGLIRVIVGRENAGYWVTFKIYAYTSVVELLTWVPVLWVIASAYGYYLIFIAVREAHSATRARAAIVAAIPFAVFVLPPVIGMVRAL